MNQTAPKRRNENRTKVLIYPLVSRTFRPNGKQCDFFPFIQQHPTPTPSSSTAWTVPEHQHQSRSPPAVNGFSSRSPLVNFIWIYVHMYCIFFHPFTPWTPPNSPKNIPFSTIHYLYTLIHSIRSTLCTITHQINTPLLHFKLLPPLNPTFYPYFTHILESTKICITE